MALRYYVRLKDQAGERVAEFDDWRTLSFAHRENSPGSCVFAMNGADPRVALFEEDAQLEVWRSDKENTLAWYLEWEGLCVSPDRRTDGEGLKTYTTYCAGYLDFLARRTIAYKTGTPQAQKSMDAAMAILEYVRENAVDLATTANGREAAGTVLGLSLGSAAPAGTNWRGSRSQKNLLETIQGIADEAGLALDIVGTGGANFDFIIYAGQRGTDRTQTNINKATGLNASGYAPVVFALEYGNMAVPQYSLARAGSINRVYVLGQNTGSARVVVVRENIDALAGDGVSPWALREAARNASNEATVLGLEAVGDTVLEEKQARESFSFDVLQLPAQFYGKHYTWGDRVTARYDDIQRSKRIVGVRVTVAATEGAYQESVTADFADVP